MPTFAQSDIPTPRSWEEFEDIVRDLYAREWGDPTIQRHGRAGQAQYGVDIYGQPQDFGGGYAGIQCKRYAEGRLSCADIKIEVSKAERFTPKLVEFIVATTERRDARLQAVVREIDQQCRSAGKFAVRIVFWEDLVTMLTHPDNEDLLRKHYPQFFTWKLHYTPPPLPAPGIVPDHGRLPPGYRLPFTRNALFTGRRDSLLSLAHTLLYTQARPSLITQAVMGMGGIGKTQLAIEFAFRYGRFFTGVHWLNGGDPSLLPDEVAACGLVMNLDNWPREQPRQVTRTLAAWRASGPRLVIIDNLEDVAAARDWLARLSAGTIRLLITARRSHWPRDLGLVALPLAVFSSQESLLFLRQYLPESYVSDSDLFALAKRLGYLPLALQLGARYLDPEVHPHLTVQDYLAQLDAVLCHPSMQAWRSDLGDPTGHDLDLAATFFRSWQQVTEEHARRVFLVCGYCAPNQPIPIALLKQACHLDDSGCDDALSFLVELGLLTRDDSFAEPAIHPLLAEYARSLVQGGHGGESNTLSDLADALIDLCSAANETRLPIHFYPLLPHLEATLITADANNLEQAAGLWTSLGYHLKMMADYPRARAAYERALAIDEHTYGPTHPTVATRVNNLGSVLRVLGDLEGARTAYERALAIDESVYGHDHPQVAIRLNNLGFVLKAMGNPSEARAVYERALAIDERAYGLDHPKVATRLNNLGNVLKALGDLGGAHAALERALTIDETIFGPDHPKVANDVNCLGSLLHVMGDLQGAREAFERALVIDEQTYGPDHPKVAIRLSNLGSLLTDLGDSAGAHEAWERALAIRVRFFPPNHPKIQGIHDKLGQDQFLDRQ